ncbi:hypothetical protein QYF61_008012 [Mycteria americana]|uniref:Transcription regulator Myc N-terminal domain-containing protein n=1 Tax=Mycteria americana TaxID=33587 RepID=A0AAN7N5C3_MYCAM|nr:hypothetical protein QYF61_008012 [Mycteria americana]
MGAAPVDDGSAIPPATHTSLVLRIWHSPVRELSKRRPQKAAGAWAQPVLRAQTTFLLCMQRVKCHIPQCWFSDVPVAPPYFSHLFAGVGGFQRGKAPSWACESFGRGDLQLGGTQDGTLGRTQSDPTAARDWSRSPACARREWLRSSDGWLRRRVVAVPRSGGGVPPFSFCPPPSHAEMEFDSYQHYFYDHDAQEDFHRSTAPSEDIWKKFELVPTPPLSPLGAPGEKGCCSGAEDRPGWLSRYCLAGEEPEYLIGTGEIFGNLSAFILKDCMWSGFSARERLEKAMTEKLSTGTQRVTPHKPSFAQDFGFSSSVSECVDPAAVFLCPLAESKIPASSGSEGQSDSGKGSGCGLPPAQPPSGLAATRGEPGVEDTRVHT